MGYQVYTDGAWAKYFEAGAGICEFELVKQDDVGSGTEELFDMRQRNTMPDMEAAPKIKGRLKHAHGRPIGIARGGRRARGANAGSDAQVPEYIGAHKQSNNTAELTALYYALWRAADRGRNAPAEDIYTDSLYARNITLGIWRGKSKAHAEIARNMRATWLRVQVKRGRGAVQIHHVRSHIDVPGNELADKIADRAMKNAQLVKDAKAGERPPVVDINLEWARSQMRAITGSSRLHPPPPTTSTHTSAPSSHTFPRVGVG